MPGSRWKPASDVTLAYYGFVLAALCLQLLMGANDGGTLLGSIVATGIIRPALAVVLLFISIVVAPLVIGTAVVTTLGNRIVPLSSIRMEMLYGTVAATVLWVWLAQRLRSPVSISYTFIGALLGSALASLFSGEDFRHMFRMREVLRHISNAADRIADAADIMGNIIIKDM